MIHIRLAKLEESKKILEILNVVSKTLKLKGINQWDYPWDEQQVLTSLRNKECYVLLLEGEIIGTFCISDIDYINQLSVQRKSKYISQIAITPNYQGINLGKEITSFACTLAEKCNQTLYLDCWAGNNKLKEFYIRNGFHYIGDFLEEDYYISIFQYN